MMVEKREEYYTEIEDQNVLYYKTFINDDADDFSENNKNNIGDITAIVYTKSESPPDGILSEISRKIGNNAVLFVNDEFNNNYDYSARFFFNGVKTKLFSHSIMGFLRYLYDSSVLRSNITFNLGDNNKLCGSSRPDDDMNFFIKYDEPKILELDFSLFDVISCVSLKVENLNSRFPVSFIKSNLINTVPLPLIDFDIIKHIKISGGNIVNRKRMYKDFPSIFPFYLYSDEYKIISRYINTDSIIMEKKAYPVASSILHYFLYKTFKKFQYEQITHYNRISDINSKVITKLDTLSSDNIILLSGGKSERVNI